MQYFVSRMRPCICMRISRLFSDMMVSSFPFLE